MTWLAVALLTVGVAGQRLIGMFVAGPWLGRRPMLTRLADLLPVAVVAALCAQLTFADGRALVVDARAAGFAVAAILVWRRAPFAVVVLVAAVATALVRAL